MATSSINPSISKNESLQIYEPVPTLQEITSFVVAIELWRTRLRNEFSSVVELRKLGEDEHKAVVDQLPVPGAIKDSIRKCFECVASRMFDWAEYCRNDIFENDSNFFPARQKTYRADLTGCVWRPNGLIDERENALNMLSRTSCSTMESFVITSKFCMEDEIKKLSIASIPQRFIQTVKTNNYPLAYYWLRCMTGDLSKVPREDLRRVAIQMIQISEVDTWSAIEYFWDLLSLARQTELVPKLLKDKGKRHTLRLLMKMNDVQLCRAIDTSFGKIVKNIWTWEAYQEIAVQICIHYVANISEPQFTETLWNMFHACFKEGLGDMGSIIRIWDVSLDHCKIHFLENYGRLVLDYHFPNDKNQRRFVSHYRGSFDFLWTMLRSGSAKFRRKAILRHAHDPMFFYLDSSVVDDLFRLCLPEPADMAEFRKKFAYSEYVAMDILDSLTDGDERDLHKFIARYFARRGDRMMFREAIRKRDRDGMMVLIFDKAENALKKGLVEPFEV